MRSPLIRLWRVVVDVSKHNKYLHPIGCGGHNWTAKHWFWRFYWV